jgi:aminoglycoside phosphotransferase
MSRWGTDRPSSTASLSEALAERLPGLTRVMDERWATRQLGRMMRADGSVVDAGVGSLWYRNDGSCSFRYRVRIGSGPTGICQQTLLGRVCASSESAAHYLKETVSPLAVGKPVPPPWKRWAATTADSQVALHLFPLDADLPTLNHALDLKRVGGMLDRCGRLSPSSVAIVRHSRTGSCVLRYDSATTRDAAGRWHTPAAFGKVYGDDTGANAYGFLQSVDDSLGDPGRSARSPTSRLTPVSLPAPLAYDATSRLLLTDVVPGEATLPLLVKSQLSSHSGLSADSGEIADVTKLVTSCGGALSTLHARGAGKARTRAPDDVVREVRSQLGVVCSVWPETAGQVQRCLQWVTRDLSDPVEAVLCHGDYTPSQVLSTRGEVSGLVDFDAVCWGDPAMDIGRFLAHLDLLIGRSSLARASSLSSALARSFVCGYREGSGENADEPRLLRRAAAYRALSLATSALHACRQLKDRRLGIAMSLLQTADQQIG